MRLTASVFDEFANENNLFGIFLETFFTHWYLFLLFILMIYGLKKLCDFTTYSRPEKFRKTFYSTQTILFSGIITLLVFGMRGTFILKNPPITMSHAGNIVNHNDEVYFIVNSPFTFLRLSNKKTPCHGKFFQDKKRIRKSFYPSKNHWR